MPSLITSAITALITAVLNFFGIPPGPYIGAIWIGVKVVLVAIAALVGWRVMKKKKQAEATAASPPTDPHGS